MYCNREVFSYCDLFLLPSISCAKVRDACSCRDAQRSRGIEDFHRKTGSNRISLGVPLFLNQLCISVVEIAVCLSVGEHLGRE